MVRSTAQHDRQVFRARNGRYIESYRCERCAQGAGYDYVSEPRLTLTGRGICLCARCARQCATMTDGDLYADASCWPCG